MLAKSIFKNCTAILFGGKFAASVLQGNVNLIVSACFLHNLWNSPSCFFRLFSGVSRRFFDISKDSEKFFKIS